MMSRLNHRRLWLLILILILILTELRSVANTNIVIGNREQSSGSTTIILGSGQLIASDTVNKS